MSIIILSYEDLQMVDTLNSKSNDEISSTFLANADFIITTFVKYIKESFSKYPFNEFMFKEKTPRELLTYIRTGLITIIKTAAEKAFDPQSDIYENLLIKKSLLNIQL